eukprot:TRINITY_DN91759_c0_g1_i1.p2 TRINITY_DN91759_c0_g1~~TRINITY_DN91759_c0_g1_i1.p2  ORF type:complete len:245 (-),score=58.25 TRINITY_DN91759_c0_g1_i1:124-858(-)
MQRHASALTVLICFAVSLLPAQATARSHLRSGKSLSDGNTEALAEQDPSTTTPDPNLPAVFFSAKQQAFNLNRLSAEMDTMKTELGKINGSLVTYDKTLAALKVSGAKDRQRVNNNSVMLAKVKISLTDGTIDKTLRPAQARVTGLNTTLRGLETKLGITDADLAKGTPGEQIKGFNKSFQDNITLYQSALGNVVAVEDELHLNVTQMVRLQVRRKVDEFLAAGPLNASAEVDAVMKPLKFKPR